MNKQEKVNQIKKELIKLAPFRRGCEVCHTTWHKSGMTFHHIIYKNNEKTRKDFDDGYGGMLKYYIYITPIIQEFPKRFALLCNTHHQTITKILQFAEDKQDRIFKLVKKSRGNDYK
jgi:hypothetical protein